MASIHPLNAEWAVLTIGASTRLTFRRGELANLLFDRPGMRATRVPLYRTRDQEGGDITLSKTGKTITVSVTEPPRLLLAAAEDTRGFLSGRLNALPLIDATEKAEPRKSSAVEFTPQQRRAQLKDLAARTSARLARERKSDEPPQ